MPALQREVFRLSVSRSRDTRRRHRFGVVLGMRDVLRMERSRRGADAPADLEADPGVVEISFCCQDAAPLADAGEGRRCVIR